MVVAVRVQYSRTPELRIQSQLNVQAFFKKIDAVPELAGMGVSFMDKDLRVVKLREASSSSNRGLLLRELEKESDAAKFSAMQNTRESHLLKESINTALSCSGAALSWIVIVLGGASIPLTGGASAALVVVGYSAAVASTVQCGVSGYRAVNEMQNPAQNDYLDSQEWYGYTTKALDGIALFGAASSAVATLKVLNLMKTGSSRSIPAILKGLDRAERKRLTEEIIRMNNPGISNGELKALVRSGQAPARYGSAQISEALSLQIKDALSATLTIVGSTFDGDIKAIVVGIYEF